MYKNKEEILARRSQLSQAKQELLEKRLRGKGDDSLLKIIPERSKTEPAPLSFAQQRLWFLHQFAPENSFYNEAVAVSLKGTLNVAALEQSLNEIVLRHEILRTNFKTVDGQTVQVVAPSLTLTLPVVNLCELLVSEQKARVQQLAITETQHAVDLTKDILLRGRLLKLNEAEHILLLSMHHIIFDGWSLGVIVRELAQFYKAIASKQTASLPELPIQYADFAIWQRTWLQGEVLENQLSYWKQRLSNLPVLELPTDKPRSAVQTFKGAKQFFTLSKELSEALKALSQQEDVTLFMTLLAAFKAMLHRYTNQDDIVVGSVIANRNRPEIEPLIGFFVNSLVLRTDHSGNPTFRELLARVREVTLGAYAHQDLPFEKLVEVLNPERTLSRSPLFEVMFTLNNAPIPLLELGDLTITPLEIDSGIAKFDLDLSLTDTEQGLTGYVEYDTNLFEAATIARMLGHWQIILTGIVANPDQHLADLPLLTNAEQGLLMEWNETGSRRQTAGRTERELCIHQLFEAQAARTPDAVAVVFGDQKLTYRELNQRANQLADYLQQLGVKPEILVGICVERSLEMVVGILGILKAGGAYVPLDPTYPQERKAFMLSDAQVSVLLTQQSLLPKLPQQVAQVICLDTKWELLAHQKQENPHSSVTPQNLAYVIYTSGSTGKSKGVMIAHQSLVNAYCSWEQAYQLRSLTCHLQMASFSFDVFSGDVVRSLCSGGKLVLCPRELLLAPEELYEFMCQEQVDCAEFVPVVLRNLIQYLEESNQRLDFMRLLICGSDSWYVEEYKRFRQLCGLKTRLINSFGLTEATIDSSYFETASVHLPVEQLVPIGRPFVNTQIYILDSHLQQVPIGVFGELYIGGVGLARGYCDRPQLTAAKFVPHPFSVEPGARLYQTGDLARWLPDGNIDFRGRIDYQEKIRGYRIEVGEIEATLSQHPAVSETVVSACQDSHGEKRLVAYVVQNLHYQSEAELPTQLEQEQVSQWQTIYDSENFEQIPDPTFNIRGWDSSYTGLPLAEPQMREWRDRTAERILSLNPTRVLEIGCGTGLLLFPIAPHCTQYCGTDFSTAALRYTQNVLERLESIPQVQLLPRMADNFAGLEVATFDTVIINSVVQYFPSISYLLRVLEGVVNLVQPGGFIFLGDIRSLPLLEAFHASVQLHQAPTSLSLEQLQQRIKRRIAIEQELVIDPAFFSAFKQHLPQIERVQIQPKRGCYSNELTKFRYDVILHVGVGEQREQINSSPLPSLDWQEQQLTLDSVRQLLTAEPEILRLRRVPNARILPDVKTVELLAADDVQTVGDLQMLLPSVVGEGVDPENLWALSCDFPYFIDINWSNSRTDGNYDVLLQRTNTDKAEFPEEIELKPWSAYANNPLQQQLTRQLLPQFRSYLKERLPDYMIPSVFMMLDTLPLLPNGKVDRRSLPVPDIARPELEATFVPPRNSTEEKLTQIWIEVLGVEQVGIHDNFFELGGDSILSIQIIAKANQAGLKITPKQIFEYQAIAELAAVASITGSIQVEQQSVSEYTPSDFSLVQLNEEELEEALSKIQF
ncbi:MAG: amino acid adenylation domain-containing protein [Gloeocapsa sp. UFS-A4-WI-NPMV-4B04]|jgi:amino acid adenylation domain-containing protein|nr:amino acid adenylation domain-containing protein [Gloeocapsa sp. UFS-A4-WI-NPMV-4B04]